MTTNNRALKENRHEALKGPQIIPITSIICPISEKIWWTHLWSDRNLSHGGLFLTASRSNVTFLSWMFVFMTERLVVGTSDPVVYINFKEHCFHDGLASCKNSRLRPCSRLRCIGQTEVLPIHYIQRKQAFKQDFKRKKTIQPIRLYYGNMHSFEQLLLIRS